MRLKPAPAVKPLRTEQIILFRSSSQIFAISSGSVQEVRSVDSLAGAAIDVSEPRRPCPTRFVTKSAAGIAA